MSLATTPPATGPVSGGTPRARTRLDRSRSELNASAYDTVASLILSLLVILGISATCLLVIWLSSRIFARQTAVPVVIADVGDGEGDDVSGGNELDEPELEELTQEVELPEPQVVDTLALITEAVLDTQSELADPTVNEALKNSGRRGRGTGRGGSGNGEPGIPREQRWEILFQEGNTLDLYAAQLDFFKIELGALGAGKQIFYAWNFLQGKPSTRTGAGEKEERLYMSWRQGGLKQADRDLMSRSGLKDTNRLIVQFYPPDLENQLAFLEQQFRGLKASQIRKTRFGVRQAGRGFEFFVMDQQRLQ